MPGGVDDRLDDIPGVAAAHLAPPGLVVSAYQVGERFLVVGHRVGLANPPEDRLKLLARGVRDLQLVADAPQERLIGQRFWREVGREQRKDIERHLDRLARVQRQVVDAAFQGDYPPVQELGSGDLLPPEVVDNHHAAVGLHL